MRYIRTHQFDDGILGVNLGWSLAGPPLMKVYCYIIDRIMIDTGQSHMAQEVADIARENKVKRVFLTHHHEDHSGNAAALRKALSLEVYGHALTAAKLSKPYAILPYQKYLWGRTTPVQVNGFLQENDMPSNGMVPIHTPGHAKDHTVFLLADKGVLFSGDLYLGDRIRYFRSDEDIGAQIESLKIVADLDFDMLLCAHNPRMTNGRDHIRSKLGFLENFYGNIIDLWKEGFSEKQIFNRLKLKEASLIKYFCFGNVSMINGVRSAIRHHEKQG
jgi:glyoxylase-like metal-dependent hydrolase (beta-lactamase superfamily II)